MLCDCCLVLVFPHFFYVLIKTKASKKIKHTLCRSCFFPVVCAATDNHSKAAYFLLLLKVVICAKKQKPE